MRFCKFFNNMKNKWLFHKNIFHDYLLFDVSFCIQFYLIILDMAYGLFGQATSLVCHRLMASWKAELNTALAAMELLAGLAKVQISPPNMLFCKRTVKWICDFIVYQCSRPPQSHSRDLHSMIVAAFKCLTLWLVEHSRLLYDKECLQNVLEVVELGISGSKSQVRIRYQNVNNKLHQWASFRLDATSISLFWSGSVGRA